MSLVNVRYVLFDAVGTLLAARPGVAEVYAAIGGRFGSRLTAVEIRQRFASAIERSDADTVIDEAGERQRWQRIVSKVLDDAVDSEGVLFEALWRHFADPQHWTLFDDVTPAWQAVVASGRSIGIASNFDGRLRQVCSGLPPLDACEAIFISSELGFAKPDGRFFAAIAERLAAAPHELLLVGDDRQRDYDAALAAGWQALWLDRNGSHSDAGAIADLRELVARL